MAKKNLLILCGGGGTEHDVSLASAAFFKQLIRANVEDWCDYSVHQIVMQKDGVKIYVNEQVENRNQPAELESGRVCELCSDGSIRFADSASAIFLDFVVPVVHGVPGESGEIPALLQLMQVPFLGVQHEASVACFNKVTTKMWLQTLDIPVVESVYLSDASSVSLEKAHSFFAQQGSVYVKASSQGSSVGCFCVTDINELDAAVIQARELSPYVLIERLVKGRELEVAVYEHNGELQASFPGEIICPDGFYTYEEKYNTQSNTQTTCHAENISDEEVALIQEYAKKAFRGLGLRHLSRVDFFLVESDDKSGQKLSKIYINEINTFPGHTEISMFPMMMKANGHDYSEFLLGIVKSFG